MLFQSYKDACACMDSCICCSMHAVKMLNYQVASDQVWSWCMQSTCRSMSMQIGKVTETVDPCTKKSPPIHNSVPFHGIVTLSLRGGSRILVVVSIWDSHGLTSLPSLAPWYTHVWYSHHFRSDEAQSTKPWSVLRPHCMLHEMTGG